MASQSRGDGDVGSGARVPRRSAHELRETLNVREEITKRRGRAATLVETMGHGLSHPATFAGLLAAHLAWVILNSGLIPGVVVFDPYPFTLLATIASAEAPFLAMLVLMGQHREARIDELRDEVTVEVAIQAERKAAAALQLLVADARARGALAGQGQLERLEELSEPLDAEELLAVVLENLKRVEGSEPGMSPDQ